MLTFELIESLRANLPPEDESVKELTRVLSIQDSELQERGLHAWLTQYQKEFSKKPFLAPLAHALALMLAENNIPKAFSILTSKTIADALDHFKIRLDPVDLKASIKAFIKSMPQRFTKMGFTGTPYSPLNLFCAQLAYFCVDWSRPDYQKQFWAILYPEIVSVYDGNTDSLWPLYGQAILSKNAKGELQTRFINYAEVFKMASTDKGADNLKHGLTLETVRRVFQFVPSHKAFWIGAQNKNLPETPHKNYFEFFIQLKEFLYKHRFHVNVTPDPISGEVSTDLEISLSAQLEFTNKYAPFLSGFLNYLNTESESIRRNVDAIFTHQDIRLIKIVEILLNQPKGENNYDSCFERNQRYLKILLSDSARCEFLKALPIFPEVAANDLPFLYGQDTLLLSKNPKKGFKDKNELIDAMNDSFSEHDNRPSLEFFVDEYKRILGGQAFKALHLRDFLYQIMNTEQRLTFLHIILGSPLDFSLLLPDKLEHYENYSRKIIELLPELYQTDPEIDTRINRGLNKAFLTNVMRIPIVELMKFQNKPDFNVDEILNRNATSRISDDFNFYVFMRLTSAQISVERFKCLVNYYSEDLCAYFVSMPGSFFDYFYSVSNERKSILISAIRLVPSVCLEYRNPSQAFLNFLIYSSTISEAESTQIQTALSKLLHEDKANLGNVFYSKEILGIIFLKVTYQPLRDYLFQFHKNRLVDSIMLSRKDFDRYQTLLPEYNLLNSILERYTSHSDPLLPRFVYELIHEKKMDNIELLMDLWSGDALRLNFLTLFVDPSVLAPFLDRLLRLCELSYKIDYLLGNVLSQFNEGESMRIQKYFKLGLYLTVGDYINELFAKLSPEALNLARTPDDNLRATRLYDAVIEKRHPTTSPFMFMFHPCNDSEDEQLREKVGLVAKNM